MSKRTLKEQVWKSHDRYRHDTDRRTLPHPSQVFLPVLIEEGLEDQQSPTELSFMNIFNKISMIPSQLSFSPVNKSFLKSNIRVDLS